jgi:drug/metabolite transporter (DMT)-like permease
MKITSRLLASKSNRLLVPKSPLNPSLIFLTGSAIVAFAGNSVLCRLALRETAIDAASFTSLRLASGALILWLLVRLKNAKPLSAGNWWSALALFVYAAGFSFAYLHLPTATGALLLFGAVQATMVAADLRGGARLQALQWLGFVVALAGLVILLLPGIAAPSLASGALMVAAGIAWGIYSLRGRGQGDPTATTAGNFRRALVFALLLSLACLPSIQWDYLGLFYALVSGALTSGLGYALWYAVLPRLGATKAASLQLTVPMLTALGGAVFLGESMSLQMLLASAAILGGVGLVILQQWSGRA